MLQICTALTNIGTYLQNICADDSWTQVFVAFFKHLSAQTDDLAGIQATLLGVLAIVSAVSVFLAQKGAGGRTRVRVFMHAVNAEAAVASMVFFIVIAALLGTAEQVPCLTAAVWVWFAINLWFVYRWLWHSVCIFYSAQHLSEKKLVWVELYKKFLNHYANNDKILRNSLDDTAAELQHFIVNNQRDSIAEGQELLKIVYEHCKKAEVHFPEYYIVQIFEKFCRCIIEYTKTNTVHSAEDFSNFCTLIADIETQQREDDRRLLFLCCKIFEQTLNTFNIIDEQHIQGIYNIILAPLFRYSMSYHTNNTAGKPKVPHNTQTWQEGFYIAMTQGSEPRRAVALPIYQGIFDDAWKRRKDRSLQPSNFELAYCQVRWLLTLWYQNKDVAAWRQNYDLSEVAIAELKEKQIANLAKVLTDLSNAQKENVRQELNLGDTRDTLLHIITNRVFDTFAVQAGLDREAHTTDRTLYYNAFNTILNSVLPLEPQPPA